MVDPIPFPQKTVPRGEDMLTAAGGGGGGYDGLNVRVETLERDIGELKSDMKAVRLDLAEIKGKLSGMPNTWQIVGLVFAIMAGSYAIIRFGVGP